LTEILGLPAPLLFGPFAVVRVGDASLDYIETVALIEVWRQRMRGGHTGEEGGVMKTDTVDLVTIYDVAYRRLCADW
jgi:hypothetical protein